MLNIGGTSGNLSTVTVPGQTLAVDVFVVNVLECLFLYQMDIFLTYEVTLYKNVNKIQISIV